MKRSICFDNAIIRFPDNAPPISAWLCSEIARSSSKKNGSDVTVRIVTAKNEPLETVERMIDKAGGGAV